MRHIPVLLQPVLEQLVLKPKATFIDCNLGDGGHTEAVIKKMDGDVTVVGFDLDADAIERASANIEKSITGDKAAVKIKHKPHEIFINSNFRKLREACAEKGVLSADAILYDLGLSSYEIDESGRGFSFRRDEPLLMTFDSRVDAGGNRVSAGFTAEQIINEWDEENLQIIFEAYGEEKFASRIAKAIVRRREERPILRTTELAELIKNTVPVFVRFGKIHPATKVFQALRIAVNDELNSLKESLPQAIEMLKPKGRLIVLSYHSLEDRIAKQILKQAEADGKGRNIFKKPVVPTEAEISSNPRSRSAKMRVFEKA